LTLPSDVVIMGWPLLVEFRRTGKTWSNAAIGGVVSVSLTLVLSWPVANSIDLSPVVLGGLLAGFLQNRGTDGGKRVGIRAGAIGGLPVILLTTDAFRWAGIGLLDGASLLSGLGGMVLALTITVIGVLLAVVAGLFGGLIGGWLSKRSLRTPPRRARR
jgi:hypothetical protein